MATQQGFVYEENTTKFFKKINLSDGVTAGASHTRPDLMLTVRGKKAGCELNTPNWTWGNSKPCQGCSKCIDKYNIKRVVYTTNETNHYGVITE